MGQQIQREAISRYAYLFVALLAIIQSTLIVLSTDSSFSFIYNLSAHIPIFLLWSQFLYLLLSVT